LKLTGMLRSADTSSTRPRPITYTRRRPGREQKGRADECITLTRRQRPG
jgi:hypothetical protein